jgi:hypothetical protein
MIFLLHYCKQVSSRIAILLRFSSNLGGSKLDLCEFLTYIIDGETSSSLTLPPRETMVCFSSPKTHWNKTDIIREDLIYYIVCSGVIWTRFHNEKNVHHIFSFMPNMGMCLNWYK